MVCGPRLTGRFACRRRFVVRVGHFSTERSRGSQRQIVLRADATFQCRECKASATLTQGSSISRPHFDSARAWEAAAGRVVNDPQFGLSQRHGGTEDSWRREVELRGDLGAGSVFELRTALISWMGRMTGCLCETERFRSSRSTGLKALLAE